MADFDTQWACNVEGSKRSWTYEGVLVVKEEARRLPPRTQETTEGNSMTCICSWFKKWLKLGPVRVCPYNPLGMFLNAVFPFRWWSHSHALIFWDIRIMSISGNKLLVHFKFTIPNLKWSPVKPVHPITSPWWIDSPALLHNYLLISPTLNIFSFFTLNDDIPYLTERRERTEDFHKPKPQITKLPAPLPALPSLRLQCQTDIYPFSCLRHIPHGYLGIIPSPPSEDIRLTNVPSFIPFSFSIGSFPINNTFKKNPPFIPYSHWANTPFLCSSCTAKF